MLLILKASLVVAVAIVLVNLFSKYVEKREKQAYWNGVANQFEEERYLEKKSEGEEKTNCYILSKNPKVNHLLEKHFTCDEAKIMYAIAQAESRGKAVAVNKSNRNGSIDFGYFQINTVHKPKNMTVKEFELAMYNLDKNFEYADKVLDKQGFTAWSVFNNKRYLAYIK